MPLNKASAGIFVALTVAVGAASAEPARIVAFGDSLVQGFGLAHGQGLVPQLNTWLQSAGIDASVENAGVSGDTTAGGAARVEWTLESDPDALIVLFGGNDLLRGIDPAESRRNLESHRRHCRRPRNQGAAGRPRGAAEFWTGIQEGL